MLIWDDAITDTQKFCADDSSTTQTFLERMMNVGYKKILNELHRPVTEKTRTASTVANQQYYQLPSDVARIRSVTVTISSKVYPIVHEPSQKRWNELNFQTWTQAYPNFYFVRPRFGVWGTEIGLFPTPSTSGYTITVVYEATDRDLSVTKYTTGTAAVTSGSASVTGSGTSWTSAMVGRYFKVTDADGDGLHYRIGSVTNSTTLVLENVYEGTTDSSVQYQIAQAFNLPEEMQILPCYYAAWHFYLAKQNPKQVANYKTLFDQGLLVGKRIYAAKTGDQNYSERRYTRSSQDWPTWFPASGISGS